nr:gustatory receptor 51 [Papilio machaon]
MDDKILRSMKPLLIIENCFGLFRYRIAGMDRSIEIRIQKISTSISFIWITNFIIFCLIPAINKGIKRPEILLEELPWQIITLQYAATLLIVLLQENKCQKIIGLLSEVDIWLHASYVENIYRISFKKALYLFIIFVSFCITISIMDFFTDNGNWYENFLYLMIYFERKIEIITFLHTLFMFRQRLLLIENRLIEIFNRQLSNRHRNMKITKFHGSNKVDGTIITNNITGLASSYKNIGEACHILNSSYNFLISTTPVSAFIFIISTFWASISCFKRNSNIKSLIKIIIWSFSELITIIILSLYCEKLLTARKKIKSILYNILNCDNISKNMQHQAKAFIELVDIWPLSIYGYDMYQINFKLLLNFVAVSTSFLIIIIQINDFI